MGGGLVVVDLGVMVPAEGQSVRNVPGEIGANGSLDDVMGDESPATVVAPAVSPCLAAVRVAGEHLLGPVGGRVSAARFRTLLAQRCASPQR